jgi:multiple sugar transport system permease protein
MNSGGENLTVIRRGLGRNNAAKARRSVSSAFGLLIKILIGAVLVFPYFYMACKSLMTPEEASSFTTVLLPKTPQFANYARVFTDSAYIKATFNSAWVIGFNMLAMTATASLAAFAFAKLKWKFKGLVWAVMMSTLLIPGTITQISLFVMYKNFGWLNTFAPMTVPNLFGGGAFNIFLIRQFMMGTPKDLESAAKIDGLSTFGIYLKIVMPLCAPVLVYVMISVFLSGWGDYYGPLVFMPSSDAPKTLPYLLYMNTLGSDSMGIDKSSVRMAAGVFMTVVPLIVFAFFQKKLIEGVTLGAVKG